MFKVKSLLSEHFKKNLILKVVIFYIVIKCSLFYTNPNCCCKVSPEEKKKQDKLEINIDKDKAKKNNVELNIGKGKLNIAKNKKNFFKKDVKGNEEIHSKNKNKKEIEKVIQTIKEIHILFSKLNIDNIETTYKAILSKFLTIGVKKEDILKNGDKYEFFINFDDRFGFLYAIDIENINLFANLTKLLSNIVKLNEYKIRFNIMEKKYNVTNFEGSLYSKEFYTTTITNRGEFKSRLLLIKTSEAKEFFDLFTSDLPVDSLKSIIFENYFKFKKEEKDRNELENILYNISNKIFKDDVFTNVYIFLKKKSILLTKCFECTRAFFNFFEDKTEINEDILKKLKEEKKIDKYNYFNVG